MHWVTISYCTQHLFHNQSSISFAVIWSFNDLIEQLPSTAVLSHNEIPLWVLINFEQSDNTWMILKIIYYLIYFTMVLRISISDKNLTSSLPFKKLFLIILTARFVPVFLCVHNLTSPNAPIQINIIESFTCPKNLSNQIVLSDIVTCMLEDELFLAQCKISWFTYIHNTR